MIELTIEHARYIKVVLDDDQQALSWVCNMHRTYGDGDFDITVCDAVVEGS